MSRDIAVFIKSNLLFNELIVFFKNNLNLNFELLPDSPWASAQTKIFYFQIYLTGDLDYEDDMGMNFSNYNYRLSMTIYSHQYNQETFALHESLMIFICKTIFDKLNCSCLVVEDGQELLYKQ
jgi:hypothetical protein